jgi:hypothetical protein
MVMSTDLTLTMGIFSEPASTTSFGSHFQRLWKRLRLLQMWMVAPESNMELRLCGYTLLAATGKPLCGSLNVTGEAGKTGTEAC